MQSDCGKGMSVKKGVLFEDFLPTPIKTLVRNPVKKIQREKALCLPLTQSYSVLFVGNSETATFLGLEFLPTSLSWTEKNLFTVLRPGKIYTYMNREKEFSLELLEIIQWGKERQKRWWGLSGGIEKTYQNQKERIPV